MGVDESTGQYVIPDECTVDHDRIRQQLELIKECEGNNEKSENSEKIQKKTEGQVISVDSDDDLMITEVSKPGTSKTEPAEPSKSSCQPQQTVTSQSVADFFKERREKFAAKDPKTMQAPLKFEKPTIPSKLARFFPLVLPRNRMAEKLRFAAPYNMFLTAVTASPRTHTDPAFVTFQVLSF